MAHDRIAVDERRHGPERRRLTVNITPPERLGRILIGLATITTSVILLVGAASGVAVVLEGLLLLTGLDLAVTGALGHCPLYQKLGFVPRSLQRPS